MFILKNARFHEKLQTVRKKEKEGEKTTEKNFYHHDKIKFSSVEHLI